MAEGWRPESGETISGRVAELDKGWSDWTQDFYPIVTIRSEDGQETALHCFHSVLRNRMVAIMPKIGDRLTVTYKGKQASKDGRRQISVYEIDAPDREQDAQVFWQGVGAAAPNRDAVKNDEGDIPF